MDKIKNILEFYITINKLKDILRKGYVIWGISSDRTESVADHITGTALLAIAIDSEFDFNIDISKVVMMIALHETEEIIIGDLTPFDKVSKEEKLQKGKEAVEKIFSSLTKRYTYIALLDEFNNRESKEAQFAHMCDKLECDIQIKMYEEKGYCDLSKVNKDIIAEPRVQKHINNGIDKIASIFILNDKHHYKETIFKDIAEYIEQNDILK